MRYTFRTKRAFTLIELLTVIAIIGVLVALLFPAIKSALIKAEGTKAQQGVSGLATAFRAYYTEYGKWPAAEPVGSTTPTIFVSTKLYGLLKGEDIGSAIPFPVGTDDNIIPVTYNGNPRHIVFLEFKSADLAISGTTTNFVDPWKNKYRCRFDSDYDNLVANPFLAYGPPPVNAVSAGFLAWSDGPDSQEDQGGDVPPSPLNKDNIKSW